jgi:hypothetical protein
VNVVLQTFQTVSGLKKIKNGLKRLGTQRLKLKLKIIVKNPSRYGRVHAPKTKQFLNLAFYIDSNRLKKSTFKILLKISIFFKPQFPKFLSTVKIMILSRCRSRAPLLIVPDRLSWFKTIFKPFIIV